MKLRDIRWLAVASIAIIGVTAGRDSHAQGLETNTVAPQIVENKLVLPASQTYIALSPELTYFQFRIPKRDSNTGNTNINTSTYGGTTLLAEKIFYLPPARPRGDYSTASIGAWYWYHNSQIDKLDFYGKYFYDAHLGVQLDIGGDTHLGLFEYYGFVILKTKQTPKNPFGVQVGLGPYFNRRDGLDSTFQGGDTGYAALLGLSYSQSPHVSYSGELRYINYRAPANALGLSTNDSLLRIYAGVNYRL